MLKIYGASDDIVVIEKDGKCTDEIDCFDKDVIITFSDGTVILVGYSKPNLAVWYIKVKSKNNSAQNLVRCEDEDAEIYSDIFTIGADISDIEVVGKDKK